jgi:ligand-binding sensor domain-containing protein
LLSRFAHVGSTKIFDASLILTKQCYMIWSYFALVFVTKRLFMPFLLRASSLLIILIWPFCSSAQDPLGTWRDYLNYTITTDVDILGNKVFVATSNAMFTYNLSDGQVERLNRINGLSDIGITLARAYPDRNLLLVGYQNGNMDLIQNNAVRNFLDLRNSTAVGNKAVRHATFQGDFAFISTGVGILRFDVERFEVRDTYTILPTTALSVNETAILNDTIWAATADGLYFGSLQTDLSIFSNWQQDLSLPNPFAPILACAASNGLLYAVTNENPGAGLLRRDAAGNWTNIGSSQEINSLRSTPAGLIYSTPGYIELRTPDGLENARWYSSFNGNTPLIARATAQADGTFWIADRRNGLVRITPGAAALFIAPDGPATNDCFSVNLRGNEVWIASGAPFRPGLWNNAFRLNGFYGLRDGSWKNFTTQTLPILQELLFFDIPHVYPDPDHPNRLYVSSWFSGLLEIENDQVKNHYTTTNSTLANRQEFIRPDGLPYVAVTGMTRDHQGNLWMANGFTTTQVHKLKPDGTWQGFNLPVASTLALVHILINRDGDLWMIRNNQGIVAWRERAGTDDDPHLSRQLTAQTGQGGLPANEVYALAEDLDGQIWVGTSDGVAVFFSPFDVFTSNPSDARQILVERDGIFQFLFEGQPVSAIAVDGANRKWIGTFGSGLFLMSPDGTRQLKRFTTANSPLPSDVIRDIKINPRTGEVFISTEEGLMSYRGDAVAGRPTNECNKVYPNPVRENYNGPITIEGTQRNAQVRITDVRGNLVASIVSDGGNAIWDGRNLNRERVATGVYFALVTSEDGSSTCTTKVMVIR